MLPRFKYITPRSSVHDFHDKLLKLTHTYPTNKLNLQRTLFEVFDILLRLMVPFTIYTDDINLLIFDESLKKTLANSISSPIRLR